MQQSTLTKLHQLPCLCPEGLSLHCLLLSTKDIERPLKSTKPFGFNGILLDSTQTLRTSRRTCRRCVEPDKPGLEVFHSADRSSISPVFHNGSSIFSISTLELSMQALERGLRYSLVSGVFSRLSNTWDDRL